MGTSIEATHTVDLQVNVGDGRTLRAVPCRLLSDKLIVKAGAWDSWGFSRRTGRAVLTNYCTYRAHGVSADLSTLAPIPEGTAPEHSGPATESAATP